MRIIESSNVEDKKPYKQPRLIRQGHVSKVTTQKTGPEGDQSPNFPNDKSVPASKDIRSGGGSASGDSETFFNNFFDN